MRQSTRNAFTLVELLVVIAIIGTLVGLLLPAVQAAREAARANTCRSNMTNLQKAITQREQTQGQFAGYTNLVGPAGDNRDDVSRKLRASWVVMTFPYIEQPALWDAWTKGRTAGNSFNDLYSSLELLVCPSDPPETVGEPVLSYAANAGFIQREPTSGDAQENPANGVFTDQTRVPNSSASGGLPQDIRDTPGPDPLIGMTSAYIGSKGDGLTNTIMLSENLKAYLWGYAENEHHGSNAVPDKKYHFGVCWEDPAQAATAPTAAVDGYKTEPGYRKINGQRVDNAVLFTTFSEDNLESGMQRNYGFPSSNHSGGVNMAFCGGAVKFVSEEISPLVYAQLMTSNRKASNLIDANDNNRPESKMRQPSDNDY